MVEQDLLTPERIERVIGFIRGHKVILDSDLAGLYGVETRRLNEQMRRNRERFPADFAFQVTAQEAADLKSQIATSSPRWGGKRKLQRQCGASCPVSADGTLVVLVTDGWQEGTCSKSVDCDS